MGTPADNGAVEVTTADGDGAVVVRLDARAGDVFFVHRSGSSITLVPLDGARPDQWRRALSSPRGDDGGPALPLGEWLSRRGVRSISQDAIAEARAAIAERSAGRLTIGDWLDGQADEPPLAPAS